jgi:hypothetical protein
VRLSLHITARIHLDWRIHRGWMGQASRSAPLLSACTRMARGGPILTIVPAFDGLKVFPSLAGLSIARFGLILARFRLASPPVSQPTGFPHLPHSQEGYGASLMLRCRSIYPIDTGKWAVN